MPNQHTVKPPPEPVVLGQVRADKKGGTIKVAFRTPGTRYVCQYPQLDDETLVMSADVIMALYPIVVSS